MKNQTHLYLLLRSSEADIRFQTHVPRILITTTIRRLKLGETGNFANIDHLKETGGEWRVGSCVSAGKVK
jgi:hypothetical protein